MISLTCVKLAAAIGLCLVVFVVAGPASASCAEPPIFAQGFGAAPLVFTGTVVSTESSDRVAHVAVDAIWKGDETAAEVTVYGTPDPFPGGGFMSISSIDRTFQMGVRYVFFPVTVSDPYEENSCTLTQPLTAEIEKTLIELAGGEGSAPVPAPLAEQIPEGPASVAAWLLPSAVGVVAAGFILLAWKRRPRRVEVEGFRLSGDREVGPD